MINIYDIIVNIIIQKIEDQKIVQKTKDLKNKELIDMNEGKPTNVIIFPQYIP